MILLRSDQHRKMLWANGGGITWEVAAHPADASLSEFEWRVSIAQIDQPGDFSVFPGVDRTLILLSGEQMLLTINNNMHDLRDMDQVHFAGEDQVAASLPAGVTRDINVITRRGVFTSKVRVVDVSTTVHATVDSPTVVVVARGSAQGDSDDSLALEGDAFLVTGSMPIEITGLCVAVEFSRVS